MRSSFRGSEAGPSREGNMRIRWSEWTGLALIALGLWALGSSVVSLDGLMVADGRWSGTQVQNQDRDLNEQGDLEQGHHLTQSQDQFQSQDLEIYDTPVNQYGGAIRVILPEEGTSRAWIGHGTRIAQIDIEDPTEPRLIGHGVMLDDVVTGLAREGDWLYAMTRDKLSVLALDDAFGAPVGQLDLPARVAKFYVSGQTAYLLHAGYGSIRPSSSTSLSILDLSDPQQPKLARTEVFAGEGTLIDMLLWQGRLYVTHLMNEATELEDQIRALSVFDVSNPLRPKRIVRLIDPAWGFLAAHPGPELQHRIYGVAAGLVSFDLRDPEVPVEISRYEDEMTHRSYAYSHGDKRLVVDKAGHAYFMEQFDGSIISRSDSSRRPEELIPWAGMGGGAAGAFALLGNMIVVSETSGRIHLLDTRLSEQFRDIGLRPGTLDLTG